MEQESTDNKPKEPYSHHIFLLPFRWDYRPSNASNQPINNIPFTARTDLGSVQALLEKYNLMLSGETVFEPYRHWKRYYFTMNQARDYNEFTYFYESVRQVIFDKQKDEETVQNDRILLQYDYQYEKATYRIVVDNSTKNKISEKEYILPVTDIVLNFYQSGIAIISFHLDNFSYPDPADILKINETGRRIYPPFLGDKCMGNSKPTDKPMSIGRMAKSITLWLKHVELEETFNFYNAGWQEMQQKPERMPKFVHNLLGPHFVNHETECAPKQDYIIVHPLIDDRMFTICWYGNDKIGRKLSRSFSLSPERSEYGYETDSWWHSFMFVDGSEGGNLANNRFRSELNRQHSYDRWIEYGTLYGITRYSFVGLSGLKFGWSDLLPNMQTMYFQLVMLALVQRASLIRFAEEATSLASLQSKDEDFESNIQGLYEKYLKFVNKMHFTEVTAQEQGIDLYNKLTHFIHLEKEVATTNKEIDDLFKYASLKAEAATKKAEEGTKKRLTQLTILVSVFTIPSFLLSYYGMDFVKQAAPDPNQDSVVERALENHGSWAFFAIMLLFGLNISFFWKDIKDNLTSKGESKTVLLLLLVLVFSIMLAPIISSFF